MAAAVKRCSSAAMGRTAAVTAAAALGCLGLIALAPAAGAHSPTDFLKVPVGRQATVLLPPISRLPGLLQITIDAPESFDLAAVSAGPGWQSRVAPHMAVLDGRGGAGASVLVTITGTAKRAGRLPLLVQVSSTSAPPESYQWPLTALAGYSQPVAAAVGASRPDAPVAVRSGHSPRLWPASIVLALIAFALLVVRPSRGSIGQT